MTGAITSTRRSGASSTLSLKSASESARSRSRCASTSGGRVESHRRQRRPDAHCTPIVRGRCCTSVVAGRRLRRCSIAAPRRTEPPTVGRPVQAAGLPPALRETYGQTASLLLGSHVAGCTGSDVYSTAGRCNDSGFRGDRHAAQYYNDHNDYNGRNDYNLLCIIHHPYSIALLSLKLGAGGAGDAHASRRRRTEPTRTTRRRAASHIARRQMTSR